MSEDAPTPDGIVKNLPPIDKDISYHNITTVTEVIIHRRKEDINFSTRRPRFMDLQRALRDETATGGITQDRVNGQLATLMAGIDDSSRVAFDQAFQQDKKVLYTHAETIVEKIRQKHEEDPHFQQKVKIYSSLIGRIRSEVAAKRIMQEEADYQIATLLAGMDDQTRAAFEQ